MPDNPGIDAPALLHDLGVDGELEPLTGGYWNAVYRVGGDRVAKIYADRKSTRLNSSHSQQSRMPSSA